MRSSLKKAKNKGFRFALWLMAALTVLACGTLAFIMMPITDKVAFAATDEATLLSAIENAPTYGDETEVVIQNDFTVDGNALTVIAGKNIRFTGNGVLTFQKPLQINAEAQLTFDVETVFDGKEGKEGNLTVNGTLTVNSRLYNTAAITVANAEDRYAEIQSKGLIIGGSLNNDAANGGTITVNDGATLATRASAAGKYDGGTLMLKNAETEDGYTLGLEVKEGGTLTNNGSVIYEASPENAADEEYYTAPCLGAVAATFVDFKAVSDKNEVDNEFYLLNNQAGNYVLYAGESAAKADLLAGGDDGTGTINIDNQKNNPMTMTLLAFGKITYNAVGGIRIQINNATLNLGGNENITQGANELIFDGGAIWQDLGEVNYANIAQANYNGNILIFYNEDNKPHYYENIGGKSNADNQGQSVNHAFFKIGTTGGNQTGSLSMYGGAKITNHETVGDNPSNQDPNMAGGAVCVAGNGNGTFNMYGGEISWCAVTNRGDGPTGGAIYNDEGTVNIYGGEITHNATSSFGAGSGDAAGIANFNGTVNMSGGEVSYNHGALYNGAAFGGADGGGIQVWGGGAVLNLYGGEIYGNFTGGAGGGIATYQGTINMFGGTVRDNRAAFGGGINDIEGTLNISGGEIINNEAFRSTINDGVAGGYGGGICTGSEAVNNQKNGIITISGDVKVSGNKAYYGGGVAVYTSYRDNANEMSNSLIMTDGTIIGNTAYELPAGDNGYYATYGTPVSANGGGVYVYAYNNANNGPATPMLVLSGDASIDSSNSVSLNYADGLNLNNVAPIRVNGKLTASGLGALLYLNENSLGKFYAADDVNNPIISFEDGLTAATYLDKFVLDDKNNHLVAVPADNYITYNDNDKIVAQIKEGEATGNNGALNANGYYEFDTLKAAFEAANADAVIEIVRSTTISEGTLNGRFGIDKNVTIMPEEGKDVTLIVASTADFTEVDALFRVVNGNTLTLKDNGDNSRLTIDGNGSGRYNETGGASNITLVLVDGGNFVMNGNVYLRGNVTTRAASAVEITSSGGTFTMNGGVIENNTSTNVNGSAVYAGSGTVTVNDGTIQNNVTDNANSGNANYGIYLAGGALKLDGVVTFKNNQVYMSGANSNIYVESNFNAANSSQIELVIPAASSLAAGTAIVHIAADGAQDISKKFELFENPNVELGTSEGKTAGYPVDFIVIRSVTYVFDPNGGQMKDGKTLERLVAELTTDGVDVLARNTDGGLFILVRIKYGATAFDVSPITDFYYRLDGGVAQNITAWGRYSYNTSISYEDSDSGQIILTAKWENAVTVRYVDDRFDNGTFTDNDGRSYGDTIVFHLESIGFQKDGYQITGWKTVKGTTETRSVVVAADLIDEDGYLTLTAVWEEIVYSINYNLNNGNFEDDADAPATYTITTEELNIPDPVREGYTFDGWFTMSGQQFTFEPGQIGDITLFASWSGDSYKVTFDPNGGKLPDGEPETRTYSAGVSYTLPTPTSPTGYEFIGWYIDGDAAKQITSQNMVTELSADTTLKALWEAITYTVTFVHNDGTNQTSATAYTVESENITYPTLTRKHYGFGGWYTTPQGLANTKFTYTQGETVGNLTLYADWNALDYKIAYVTNGGNYLATTKYTVEDQTLQLPTPLRAGYNFLGWYTDAAFGTQFTYVQGTTTGDFTLYAKWSEPIAYTITYVLNDGTGAQKTDTYNVLTTVINLPTEMRSGYKFLGWQYGDGETHNGTLTPPAELGNIRLTALWQAITYTVTFDVGGKANQKANQTIAYGGETTVDLSAPQNIKNGYTFGEWQLKLINGTSGYTGSVTLAQILATNVDITYNPDGTAGTISFTAKWNLVQYTITYVPNNGDGVSYDFYTAETTDITLKTLDARAGYTFKGWLYNGITYNGTLTPPTALGNITLTAQWEAIEYTITYNSKGGNALTATKYTVENQTIELSIPNRLGYNFLGWQYNGALIEVDENGKCAMTRPATPGNITLTASWEVIEYTITYVHNDGTPDTTEKYTVENAVTLPADLTRGDEYTFAGWFDNITFGGNNITGFAAGETGNKTYYAKWTAKSYTITYVLGGGANNAANPATYTVESADITLYPATRAGYTFGGWKNATGQTVTTIAKGTSGDITLTAQWTPITYKITYVLNGGVNNAANPATYTVETANIALTDAVRTGYEFQGWYTDAAFGTQFAYVQGTTTGDITLYAKWSEPVVYTIVYDADGGSDVAGGTCNINDATVTLAGAPTKAGYTFDGWKLKLGGGLSEVVYSGSVSLRQILNAENVDLTDNKITFVAQWKATPYYVTYVLGGGTVAGNTYTTEYTVETENFVLPTVNRTNYDFLGWYTDAAHTTQFTYTKGTTIGNLTLFANWNATTVTITISAGNGKFNAQLPEKYDVNTDRTEVTLSVAYDAEIYSELVELKKYLVSNNGDDSFIAWDMESVLASYYAANEDAVVKALYSSTQVSVTLIYLTGDVDTVLIGKGDTFSTAAYGHTTESGYTGTGWKYYDEDEAWVDGSTVGTSITLQEIGDAITYTVTLNADGGNLPDVGKLTVAFGGKYGVLPTPTKAGYTFVNWTDEYGNVITADSTVSIAKAHELKANWTLTKYTIIFDLDGGNGNVATLTGQTIDDSITLANITKLAYTFGGWKPNGWTAADGLKNNVKVEDIINYAVGDTITLTAQWTAKEYILKFTGGTIAAADVKLQLGATEKVNLSTVGAGTKNGYTFGGWALNGVVYNDELSLEEILSITGETNAAITFTAVWTAEEYTITYNMNIADNSASKGYINSNPLTYTVESDLALQDATRDGYTFGGWYTDAALSAQFTYVQGTTTGDITLYAKWTVVDYTITYNLNGGANNAANPATYTVETADITLLSANKDGYDFLGWFDGNGNQVSSIARGSRVDYTLDAKWEVISYTITYNLDGGSNHRDNPATYTVETSNITLQPATRDGYTFDGWYSAQQKITTINKGSKGNITLTAKWTAITYTVKLTDGENSVDTISIDYSDNASVPLKTPDEKDGYLFYGWRVGNSTYTVNVSLSNLIEFADSNNVITLTAVWTALGSVDSYAIVYELNGGTLDLDTAPHSYSPGVVVNLIDPVKEYHKFLGWYLNSDFTGDRVTNISSGTGDLRLYAKWERESIDLKGSIEGWTYGETPNTPVIEGGYKCIFLYGLENNLNGVWSSTVPTDANRYYVLMFVKYDGDDTLKPTDKNESGWRIVEFTISKRVIAAPELKIIESGDGKNNTYTGRDLAAFILNYDSLYMTIAYDGTITTTNGFAIHATNAGSYTVTITLENSNYVWLGANGKTSLELTWTIAKQKVALPTAGNTVLNVNGRIQTYLPDGFNASIMKIKGNREAFGGTFTATVWLADPDNYEWEDETTRELTFKWTMGGINKVFVIVASTLGGACGIAGAAALIQFLADKAKKKRAAADIAARSAEAESEGTDTPENTEAESEGADTPENTEAESNGADTPENTEAESNGADASDNAETQNVDGEEETK